MRYSILPSCFYLLDIQFGETVFVSYTSSMDTAKTVRSSSNKVLKKPRKSIA